MNTIEKIRLRSSSYKPGEGFTFHDMWRSEDTDAALFKALSRMVKAGELQRVIPGVFYKTITNDEYQLDIESIAKKVASMRNYLLQIHGSKALEVLLPDEYPANPKRFAYYTNGNNKKIIVEDYEIEFFHSRNLKIYQKPGTKIGLVMSALCYVGKDNLTPKLIERIKTFLTPEELDTLQCSILTDWMLTAIFFPKKDRKSKHEGDSQ